MSAPQPAGGAAEAARGVDAGPAGTSSVMNDALTPRDRAVLRAVHAGRCRLAGTGSVVLVVDGVACCDQFAAARLVRDGLITAPAGDAPARLTATGRALLAA